MSGGREGESRRGSAGSQGLALDMPRAAAQGWACSPVPGTCSFLAARVGMRALCPSRAVAAVQYDSASRGPAGSARRQLFARGVFGHREDGPGSPGPPAACAKGIGLVDPAKMVSLPRAVNSHSTRAPAPPGQGRGRGVPGGGRSPGSRFGGIRPGAGAPRCSRSGRPQRPRRWREFERPAEAEPLAVDSAADSACCRGALGERGDRYRVAEGWARKRRRRRRRPSTDATAAAR